MRVRNREGKKAGKGEKGASEQGSGQELCPGAGMRPCRAKLPKLHAGAQQAGSGVSLPTPPGSSRRAQIPHPQCHRSGCFPFHGELSRVPTALRCSGTRSRTPNPPSSGHQAAAVLRVPLLSTPAHPEPTPKGSSTSLPPHTPHGHTVMLGVGAGCPAAQGHRPPPLLLLRPARCHGSS